MAVKFIKITRTNQRNLKTGDKLEEHGITFARLSNSDDQNLQIYPFIVIGLETAMRNSEILAIRLEHIDLAKRIIYIPQAKAGARQQPITSHLAELLKFYIE